MSGKEVEGFLTYLAVEENVAALTQNQDFNNYWQKKIEQKSLIIN